jgi:hypothetical protein
MLSTNHSVNTSHAVHKPFCTHTSHSEPCYEWLPRACGAPEYFARKSSSITNHHWLIASLDIGYSNTTSADQLVSRWVKRCRKNSKKSRAMYSRMIAIAYFHNRFPTRCRRATDSLLGAMERSRDPQLGLTGATSAGEGLGASPWTAEG